MSEQVNTYVQGHDESTLASHRSRTAAKQASYLIPHIKSNHKILDIGCGPGTITCDLANLASEGSTIGIDASPEVIQQAQSEAQSRQLTNVTFQIASAHTLPFEDNVFDIVHCHAVLVHLPRPAEAVAEMRRVCKTGGLIAAREPDWGTAAIHPFDARLENWLCAHRRLKTQLGAEPNTGRFLASWAAEAGFKAEDFVEFSMDCLLYSGKEEVEWWGGLYASRLNEEEGIRSVEAGVATKEEVEGWVQGYREWSGKGGEGAVWALMHGRLLVRK